MSVVVVMGVLVLGLLALIVTGAGSSFVIEVQDEDLGSPLGLGGLGRHGSQGKLGFEYNDRPIIGGKEGWPRGQGCSARSWTPGCWRGSPPATTTPPTSPPGGRAHPPLPSYVKWVEAGGARAVPIMIGQTRAYYNQVYME